MGALRTWGVLEHQTAPEVAALLREDAVEVVLITPT
jgi:hypothetical protein